MTRPARKRRFGDLPAPAQAGILCDDAAFQAFVADRSGMQGEMFSASACAEYIRRQCGVTSRADLARAPAAARRFADLRTEFDAWSGRLPQPREV